MSATSAEPRPSEPQSRALRIAFRSFAAIEKVGNKLPHPFWLFWILAGVVAVLSAVLATIDVSAVHPGKGESITVKSLLSQEGLTMAIEGAVDNFAAFPPLATILTVMFGIVVGGGSGGAGRPPAPGGGRRGPAPPPTTPPRAARGRVCV
ncbi:AbgT family transporter [Streptomyces sp. NPDC058953]